ncbi:uncharacterized protein C1orf232 [Nerophis lumbriciformis]|uniref:uncharacterized protein C1orf232 n=1 Tax=Nerophis lumbriciformis TaxID=546530 RepID=UPI002ADFB6FA|nr:uncharacterized protein C1orf232 [Nerophis lumbriciformis]
MNPLWRVYKSKVLKTLNPEYVEETADEVCEMEEDLSPVQEDEGQNAVSQLARKMQGAGVRSWNKMSALFYKDDQHQLLRETESPPVPDHPLAARPEELPPPTKRSGFWDGFAANWAAKKQAEAAQKMPEEEEEVMEDAAETPAGPSEDQAASQERRDGEMNEGSEGNNSFSKYVSLGGGRGEDAAFRWNFVSSKLAEMRSKSVAKSNSH